MTSAKGFPAVDAQKELNPGAAADKDFQVDPISANVATSKEIKEHYEEAERKEQEKDALQNLKTVFIVSGIVVAVAGAIFAITKKLREK